MLRAARTRPDRRPARPLPHPRSRPCRVSRRLRLRPHPVGRLAPSARSRRTALPGVLHPTTVAAQRQPRRSMASRLRPTLRSADPAVRVGEVEHVGEHPDLVRGQGTQPDECSIAGSQTARHVDLVQPAVPLPPHGGCGRDQSQTRGISSPRRSRSDPTSRAGLTRFRQRCVLIGKCWYASPASRPEELAGSATRPRWRDTCWTPTCPPPTPNAPPTRPSRPVPRVTSRSRRSDG